MELKGRLAEATNQARKQGCRRVPDAHSNVNIPGCSFVPVPGPNVSPGLPGNACYTRNKQSNTNYCPSGGVGTFEEVTCLSAHEKSDGVSFQTLTNGMTMVVLMHALVRRFGISGIGIVERSSPL